MTAETPLKVDVTDDTLESNCRFASAARFAITQSVRKIALNVTLTNRESGFSFLVRNLSAQDGRFRGAFRLLDRPSTREHSLAARLRSVFAESWLRRRLSGVLFTTRLHARSPRHNIFDLASLTKVVATTAMAMILYERGLLDLEAPVTVVVPEFAEGLDGDGDGTRRREVTLRMLLAHSSGLPAYEKLFLRATTRDELLHAAFTTPLDCRARRAS